jgi:hypothetical protein
MVNFQLAEVALAVKEPLRVTFPLLLVSVRVRVQLLNVTLLVPSCTHFGSSKAPVVEPTPVRYEIWPFPSAAARAGWSCGSARPMGVE